LKANPTHALASVIIILGVLFLSADYLHIKSNFFQVSNYILLLIISLFQIDFRKLNYLHYCLLFLSIAIPIFHALVTEFDLSILLKYCLMSFILFIAIIPSKNLSRYSNSYFLYPWTILVFVGFIQVMLVFLIPEMSFIFGETRPVGFSSEPTFFSQQLLILWLLCLIFCNVQKNFFFQSFELLMLIVIISCATRTSMLLAVPIIIYRLLQQNTWGWIKLSLIIPFIGYYITKIEFSFLEIFLLKLTRLFKISGEPREVAFSEMLNLMYDNGFLGAGYLHIESSVGLAIGSLYGNLIMSLIFTFGLLAIFPLSAIYIRLSARGASLATVPFVYIILISQIMPYFFTAFGLFTWIIAASKR
jgi:hypothetical protein